MKIIERLITKESTRKIALALGYFDSVHLGHCSLISECVNSQYIPAVFTFRNNPESCFNGNNKQCFTYVERVDIFSRLGVKEVISSEFNTDFRNMSGYDFLSMLTKNNNIKLIVVGSDFSCGYNAEYHVQDIVEFFRDRAIDVIVKDLIENDGVKIASSDIKNMLADGKIEHVNKLLPFNYQISGIVGRGRNVGGQVLGYPTANIPYPSDKIEIKSGVYKTNVIIDGVRYLALTNVGNHPTFDDYNYNIESYIIGFQGNIYNDYINVEFLKYLREVRKFDNATDLHAQITSDFDNVMSDNDNSEINK